jgi:hypothetical protein
MMSKTFRVVLILSVALALGVAGLYANAQSYGPGSGGMMGDGWGWGMMSGGMGGFGGIGLLVIVLVAGLVFFSVRRRNP